MKKLRKELLTEEIAQKSAEITSVLFSLDCFKNAKTVMVYLSAFKEVDTSTVIERLRNDGKKIVVPISNTDTFTITPSYINGFEDMHKGAYGIWEPDVVKEAAVGDIDLIIVPGIAFDERANRCGFGKGYYDRLLSESRAVKIGLCYDFQIVGELETDEYDIPMDMVISERRIINAVANIWGQIIFQAPVISL